MSAQGRHIGLPLQLMPVYVDMTTCKSWFDTRPCRKYGVTYMEANQYQAILIEGLVDDFFSLRTF